VNAGFGGDFLLFFFSLLLDKFVPANAPSFRFPQTLPSPPSVFTSKKNFARPLVQDIFNGAPPKGPVTVFPCMLTSLTYFFSFSPILVSKPVEARAHPHRPRPFSSLTYPPTVGFFCSLPVYNKGRFFFGHVSPPSQNNLPPEKTEFSSDRESPP